MLVPIIYIPVIVDQFDFIEIETKDRKFVQMCEPTIVVSHYSSSY